MEKDSIEETSKLIEFPKIYLNSNSVETNTNKNIEIFYQTISLNNSTINKNPIENKINTVNNSIISQIETDKNLIQPNPTIKNVYEEMQSIKTKKTNLNNLIHMNFNKLSTILVDFQKKNSSNISDPVNKYIKDYVPYYKIKYKKEKITPIIPTNNFINENKEFMQEIKKLSFNREKMNLYKTKALKNSKKIEIPEKTLNFSKNKQNFFCSRMYNNDSKVNNKNFESKIILLQKNIRGFISRNKFENKIRRLIVECVVKNTLKIQKWVRKLLFQKNFYKNQIIGIIENERKIKANKLIDIFQMYHLRNKYKKILIINKILNIRKKHIVLIQSFIRSYLIKNKVNQIRNLLKDGYEITYPYNKEINEIKLKIYKKNNVNKIFDLHLCPIRKIYVVYLNKKNLFQENKSYNKLTFHFIINGKIVIDKRYPIIKNKKNVKFNLIKFKNENIKQKKQESNLIIPRETVINDYYQEKNSKLNSFKKNILDNYFKDYSVKKEFNDLSPSPLINQKDNNFKTSDTSSNNIVYKRKISAYSKKNNHKTSTKTRNYTKNDYKTIKNKSEIISYNDYNSNIKKRHKISSSINNKYIKSYCNDCNNLNDVELCIIRNNTVTDINNDNNSQKSFEENSDNNILGNSNSTVSNSRIYKKNSICNKNFVSRNKIKRNFEDEESVGNSEICCYDEEPKHKITEKVIEFKQIKTAKRKKEVFPSFY